MIMGNSFIDFPFCRRIALVGKRIHHSKARGPRVLPSEQTSNNRPSQRSDISCAVVVP
jgi:hypothetical protein